MKNFNNFKLSSPDMGDMGDMGHMQFQKRSRIIHIFLLYIKDRNKTPQNSKTFFFQHTFSMWYKFFYL